MQDFKGKFTVGLSTVVLLIVVIGGMLLLRSLVIIEAGEVGVVTLFGKVEEESLRSGLQLKNPLANVNKMEIRTQEYTMSSTTAEGTVQGDDSIKALASDGASVWLDVTAFYHLQPESAPDVYRELGLNYDEKIIRPEIRSTIRQVVAEYTVNEIYSSKRDELSGKILENLKVSLAERGIEVEDVLLRNVTLSNQLFESIEQKLTAQQDAQKKDFEIEKEGKEAKRKVIEAKGQRDAQALINETLTNKYLYYQYILSLKENQGTVYVPTEGGLPLFKNVD